MVCPWCGFEMEDECTVCPTCGGDVRIESTSGGIRYCADGKYRWTYDMNLWKDFSSVWEMVRLFFIMALITWLLLFLTGIGNHGVAGALRQSAVEAGVLFGIFTALTLIAYPCYSLLMGGRYSILFEMDDKELCHTRMEKQVVHEELVDWLDTINEYLKSDVIGTALDVRTAASTAMISEFEYVKRIKIDTKESRMTLSGIVTRNKVYTAPEDMQFVCRWIREHCPNARVTGS